MLKLSLLQQISQNAVVALVLTLVLAGIGLSGRVSLTMARGFFAASWVIGVAGLWGAKKLGKWLQVVTCLLFTAAMVSMVVWARPKVLPENVGRLDSSSRSSVLWSVQEPKFTLEFGDSGVTFNWNSEVVKGFSKLLNESQLTIERSRGQILVSSTIRDSSGKVVAQLIRNEWRVSPGAWDRNYTKDALEVKNDQGRIVLQIKLLEDRIQILGEWWNSEGKGVRIFKGYRGRDEGGAGILILSRTINSDEPAIKPMFEYPSEFHLGELKR